MIAADLKRKIRKLKQFENTVRKKNNMTDGVSLVWDKFFNLREEGNVGGIDSVGSKSSVNNKSSSDSTAMYSLSQIKEMNKGEYKAVVDEFFARVYYEVYIHNGLIDAPIYDPGLLDRIGLSPVADEEAVKKRFRELAMKYHPDKGGDPTKFIELMSVYRELID